MPEHERQLLLVDDEAAILSSLKRELHGWARDSSLTIVTAGSAQEALAHLDKDGAKVAVLLTDMRMPGGSGTDLLTRVRERFPRIVAMLLTGFADIGDVIKAIHAGAHAYILKPWEPDYLRAELAKALAIYDLRERNLRHEQRLAEDLRWAAELQSALLGIELPTDDLVSFDVLYRPMPEHQCGGDFYDIIPRAAHRYVAMVGDVAGHGVRAALVTAVLKSLVGQLASEMGREGAADPGGLLSKLNSRVCHALERVPGLLVTFCVCEIDAANRTIAYASAGHLPLLVLRGGQATYLRAQGPAMGAADGLRYDQRTHAMEPGDRLVMYTDGLIERGQAATTEGLDELRAAACAHATSPDLAAAIEEALRGEGGYDDDVTVVTATLGTRGAPPAGA